MMNSTRRRKLHRVAARAAKRQGIDRDACFYCRKRMSRSGDDPRTLEHLTALSCGGGNDPSNLRLAHKSCNEAVGNLPAELKLRLAGQMERGTLPEWARVEALSQPTSASMIWIGKLR